MDAGLRYGNVALSDPDVDDEDPAPQVQVGQDQTFDQEACVDEGVDFADEGFLMLDLHPKPSPTLSGHSFTVG